MQGHKRVPFGFCQHFFWFCLFSRNHLFCFNFLNCFFSIRQPFAGLGEKLSGVAPDFARRHFQGCLLRWLHLKQARRKGRFAAPLFRSSLKAALPGPRKQEALQPLPLMPNTQLLKPNSDLLFVFFCYNVEKLFVHFNSPQPSGRRPAALLSQCPCTCSKQG